MNEHTVYTHKQRTASNNDVFKPETGAVLFIFRSEMLCRGKFNIKWSHLCIKTITEYQYQLFAE